MEKLNVGMIGVGGYGWQRRHSMRQTNLFNIKYAFDISQQALTQCNEEDNSEAVNSVEELVNKPDIDAVVISSGAKFHFEHIMAALDAGKHVFCEKPLVSSKEEVLAIIEKQKQTNKVVHTGHNNHETDPMSIKLKQMIDTGEIGKAVAFEKTTCHNGGLLIQPGDWRGDKDKNPGGMLFQCGVHSIYNMIFLFGLIKKISCFMRYDVHTTQTADAAICIMEFENGVVGTLNAYHVCSYRHTFNIFGTEKNIYINERYYDEGTSILYQNSNLENKPEPMLPVEINVEQPKYPTHLAALYNFYNAVKSNDTSNKNLLAAANAVMAVFAAEESAKTGKEIYL